ncbi:MAG TPA: glycerate kinase, partial [Abditibacteriaceae bacterium]
MISFLLAPDSLKGSLSASDACLAMERGIRRAFTASESTTVSITHVPLADGGEGTVEALLRGAGGEARTVHVRGPLGDDVEAQWAILTDGRAVIEMAQASGLPLVTAEKRDALRASSYGTGELIRAALDAGCRDFLIGIGGSATTDGGAGALQALGIRFFDSNDCELEIGGAALRRLARIDASGLDPRLADANIRVLCDVTNPLFGPNGAAHIYAPQKGASTADIEILDNALRRYAEVSAATLDKCLHNVPGAGAAGGMGFGLLAWCNAQLIPGIDAVLDATGFHQKLESADLLLTAEGAIDSQTPQGKALAGVARAARVAKAGRGVPVIAFGGAVTLSGEALVQMGIVAALPLPDAPKRLDQCVAEA